ncbi:MAG: hypothetical protein ACYTGG_08830 [Planctomycetota bacterium]|jgi:hypothetical protein
MSRAVRNVASAAGIFAGVGCAMHTPEGGSMPFTGGSHTFYSTETSPKTVSIIDLRTDEEIFKVEIPVGKQLTFDFVEELGDDVVYTPDLMRYEIWPIGTKTGKLRNALSVPNAASRRIDVQVRVGIEYAQSPTDRRLRTDELIDRPDWWTPDGGPLPDSDTAELYDN